MRAVQLGGVVTLVALFGFIVVSLRRDHFAAGQ
jgi:hypothetical protein